MFVVVSGNGDSQEGPLMDGWDGAGDVAVFCVVERNSGAGGDENEGNGDDDIRSENDDDLVFLMAEVKTKMKTKKNEEKDRHVVGPVPLEEIYVSFGNCLFNSLVTLFLSYQYQPSTKLQNSYILCVFFFFFSKN